MKKINPLFLLLSSLCLVFLASYVLNNTKLKNIEIINQYKQFQIMAKRYEDLNNNYKNIDFITKEIESIAKKSNIQNIIIKKKSKFLEVEVIQKDKKILDKFVNKLFNTKLPITQILFDGIKLSFKVGNI